MQKIFLTFLLICFPKISLSALAKDLGTFGDLFPIQEKSLLQVIQDKLQTLNQEGILQDHQKKIQEKVQRKLQNPPSVQGVKATVKPRRFSYDPSFVVSRDLKDHQGHIFCARGKKINPLHYRSLIKPLLFIDGENSEQVSWMQAQRKVFQNAKIVLVKGSPFKLSQKLVIPVYFDQQGLLTRKLGICQVPARVTQKGDKLWIEEVLLP
jgi:conjugal transfer pilus assembly protein TraW